MVNRKLRPPQILLVTYLSRKRPLSSRLKHQNSGLITLIVILYLPCTRMNKPEPHQLGLLLF